MCGYDINKNNFRRVFRERMFRNKLHALKFYKTFHSIFFQQTLRSKNFSNHHSGSKFTCSQSELQKWNLHRKMKKKKLHMSHKNPSNQKFCSTTNKFLSTRKRKRSKYCKKWQFLNLYCQKSVNQKSMKLHCFVCGKSHSTGKNSLSLL